MLPRLRSFARALFGRRAFEDTLDEEIQFHLDLRAADLERAGLTPDEARRRARIEFGQRETYREECRQARGLRLLDELRADLTYALRGIRGNPGFATVAVVILGLAMGVNVVFFSFFDAFVLRPLPIANPERFVELIPENERGEFRERFTRAELDGLRTALVPACEGTFGVRFEHLPLLEPTRRMIQGQAVSASYFSLLGGRPVLGRTFLAADEAADAEGVAVLSDSGWGRIFNRDPRALGTKIRLGSTSATVVGIMGPEFVGVEPFKLDLWLPLGALPPPPGGEEPRFELAGTLRPGTSLGTAADLATAALAGVGQRRESEAEKVVVKVERRTSLLRAGEQREVSVIGLLLVVAFALVLVIACANLASLFLARASARHQEIATRLSLGASRFRVVRQLLTESLLVAALAALLGTGLAVLTLEEVQQRLFAVVTSAGMVVTPITLHWHIVAYAVGLAALAGLAFGLMPALEATSRDLVRGVRRDGLTLGGRVRRQRLTGLLIAAQVASSLLLLSLAGLAIENVRGSTSLDPGYEVERLAELGFPNPTRELVARLSEEGEVESVTAVWQTPLAGVMPRATLLVDGRSEALRLNAVDERYFETLRIPLTQGRSFFPEEAAARAPVVVVSAATAARLWPGESALGRVLEVPASEQGPLPAGRFEVIGVAEDVVSGFFFQGLDSSAVYFPTALGGERVGELLVRTRGPAESFAPTLSAICTEIDPAVLCSTRTLRQVAAMQRFPFVAASVVAGGLGFLALALTAIGLYGLVAFAVVQRLREIGVRIALGASAQQVLGAVVKRALVSVALGVAVAFPLCVLLSRLAARIFTLLSGFNTLALLATPVLLAAVALLAALIPARRAMSVDPVLSLKVE